VGEDEDISCDGMADGHVLAYPERGGQMVNYYGYYGNTSRGKRRKVGLDSTRVYVSIGATEVSGTDETGVAVERADAALYRAKDAGRNRVVLADEG
jgi:GGDEF domain-containing protein